MKLQDKIHKVLSEFEQGTLKSSSGQVVRDRKQALAIAYSKYREEKGKKHARAPKQKAK